MSASQKYHAPLNTQNGEYTYFDLTKLENMNKSKLEQLPYTVKILLENNIRNQDGKLFKEEHIKALTSYNAAAPDKKEVPFTPSRVLLQDLTGVPAIVDLAALRSAMARMGGDASQVNPSRKVDLVIDHSVQVDAFGSKAAMELNRMIEFSRNKERYEFLKWGEKAFDGFSLTPPGIGIVHQVNLEYLADVIHTEEVDGKLLASPDTLVGTDSHTTMINGLGVMGWGVGGIEAEACMLGQPIYMLLPEVVGVELKGELQAGVTATDLVLYITQMLRKHNVVGKFVEFYGKGLEALSLADRATIANMAPEYGATMGYFPMDENTLKYLELTGRSTEKLELIEAYAKAQGLWHHTDEVRQYNSTLSCKLGDIEPALAGPTRPQDRILAKDMKRAWKTFFSEVSENRKEKEALVETEEGTIPLKDGAVVIAAITSCTNTSNPGVMLAAGLVAQKAHQYGLKAKPWVKTSLAPGSRVVTDYLEKSGLTEGLEAVGFYTVGYGCTTCIGNSGPLAKEWLDAIQSEELVVTSVLSGNRNFEGRVNPHTRGNYLASPPLVVAYALAGTVDIDFASEPIGQDPHGKDIFLKDLWPSQAELEEALLHSVTKEQFVTRYSNASQGSKEWLELLTAKSEVYHWSEDSTYIQEPPFFKDLEAHASPIGPIEGARCLVKVGDSTTTDHISPAGAIPHHSPAADYLRSKGVKERDFNTYGTRRGNHQVMMRGTFGNVRLQNQLAPGKKGGYTTFFGKGTESLQALKNGEVSWIYDAAVAYKAEETPLVVIAGKDYGMGSSRDWAAKGTQLLGIKAVLAASYERIHRTNLIGMGVLPLEFEQGQDAEALGLTGKESFHIHLDENLKPGAKLKVVATDKEGTSKTFTVQARIDSPVELEYYRNGGILHTVLRNMLSTTTKSEASHHVDHRVN